MATSVYSFEHFLHDLSRLTASTDEPREVLSQIIQSFHEHVGQAGVSLRLQIPTPGSSTPLRFEQRPEGNASFVFSAAIAVRGREYGQLTVEARTPVGRPQEWMLALEVFSQQLALYAERLHLLDENRSRRSELAELELSLRSRKLLARASGIVARLRDVSLEQAEAWIAAEAARRGRSVDVLSDQLMLQESVSRDIAARLRKVAVAA